MCECLQPLLWKKTLKNLYSLTKQTNSLVKKSLIFSGFLLFFLCEKKSSGCWSGNFKTRLGAPLINLFERSLTQLFEMFHVGCTFTKIKVISVQCWRRRYYTRKVIDHSCKEHRIRCKWNFYLRFFYFLLTFYFFITFHVILTFSTQLQRAQDPVQMEFLLFT